jgi:tetratricopeptide (TPR) repeat protein
MSAHRALIAVLCLAATVSCRPEDQRTDTINVDEALQKRADLAPEVVAHLDSGSAAFRADDYQGARDHFVAATEIDSDAAAAWFGVYMAEKALGNEAAAEEALQRAQDVQPGATLLRPSEDTIR